MAKNAFGNSILHDEGQGHNILKILGEYAELPETGFLAGGAVANTLLNMQWGGKFPVNDIDIFQVISVEELNSRMPHRYMRMGLFIDTYKGVDLFTAVDSRRGYAVSKTRRNGLLNLIDVQLRVDHQRFDNYKLLLEGFDLNCCQVGIDLENEKLIYLPTFESFVKTMQLEVDHPCTPFHTAIRMAKKKKELRCYCNFEVESKYLSQIPLILAPDYRNPGSKNIEYAEYFGEKYYDLYLQNKEELDRFFQVTPFLIHASPIGNNPPCGSKVTRPLNSALRNLICIPHETRSSSRTYTMVPRDSEVVEELKGCYSLNSIRAIWGLLQGKRAVRDKNIKALKFKRYLKEFLIINPRYAQCDWDVKHADQVEIFLDGHPYMAKVFLHFSLNLQEQLMAVRTIKRMADKKGLYIIGLIEEAIWKYLGDGDSSRLPKNGGITEEWIESLADDYHARNSGSLKDPEDLTDFEFGKYFTELITAKDLMSEGIRMHHCVGGYAEFIRRGESTIFHVEMEGDSSTIEVSRHIMDEGASFDLSIRQHMAAWNKEPSPLHKRLAMELIKYLKGKHRVASERKNDIEQDRSMDLYAR